MKWQHLLLQSVFGLLTTASNLSFLVPLCVAGGVVALRLLLDSVIQGNWRPVQWSLLLFITGGGAFILSDVAFLLRDGGHLFYGSTDGFWSVTVSSLVVASFHPWGDVLIYMAPLAVLVSIIILMVSWTERPNDFLDLEGIPPALMIVGCIVAIILMNVLLGVNFPSDRVALYFMPLSVLVICLAADSARDRPYIRIMIPVMLVVWSLPLNAIATANVSHTRLWQWDSCVREFYGHIAADSAAPDPIVAVNDLQWHSFHYYNYRNGMRLSSVNQHIHGADIADYQIGSPELTLAEGALYDTVLVHPVSGRFLLKRKTFRKRVPIFERDLARIDPLQEFTSFFEQNLDTLSDQDLIFDVSFDIVWPSDRFYGWIVLDAYDSNGNQTGYWYYPLEDRPQQAGNIERIKYQLLQPGSLRPSSYVKVYLWNTRGATVSISNLSTRVWMLDK